MKPFQEEESSVSYSKVTILSSTTTITEDGEIFQDASNDVSILSRAKSVKSDIPPAPKMEVLKALHQDVCLFMKKVQTPLFLRKCPLETAKHAKPPRVVHPILTVQPMNAARKCPSHSILLVSLDAPTYCVRYLQANLKNTPESVLVFQPLICSVRFLARPPVMEVVQSKLCDVSETVKLMLSPEKAIESQKMIPKWQTVTFTLAFGKHVAVKYRIIESRKFEIDHVKAKKEKIRIISTKNLYRNEPIQKLITWTPSQIHTLKLTTVEKCDPQIVKRVFLENGGGGPTVIRANELSMIWTSSNTEQVEKPKKTKKK